MDDIAKEESQRLDKWLKTVRLFKTRKSAAEACDKRLVKVNDVTSKSSKNVLAGDEIVIRLRGKYRSYKVLGISRRSLSGTLARELYDETTVPELTPEQEDLVKLTSQALKRHLPKYKGRPTKKVRRDLAQWKDSIRPQNQGASSRFR